MLKRLRCNASCKSHDELNEATKLDIGDIPQLGDLHREMRSLFPHINVFGGCCGTDDRHVDEIFKRLRPS